MIRRCVLAGAVAVGLAATAAPVSAACILGRIGELPVTMDGLTPTVAVKVNGVDARMIVDSGAWFGQLTPQAAARMKLRIGPLQESGNAVEGLGGIDAAGFAETKDFTFVGYTFHGADFVVASPQLAPLDGLIGDNLLSFADVEFDLANGAIRLFKPAGCSDHTNFAYWAKATGAYDSVPMPAAVAPGFEIIVHVQVNGHDMRAQLDSGSGRSYISRDAAKTAGVVVSGPGVRSAGVGYGVGRRSFNAWTGTFQSFRIGDEEVKNAVLEIGDGDLSDVDMLLGADFLLSHRVYVANSERQLFFSYIGGPVFSLGQSPSHESSAPVAGAAVAGASADNPLDGDAFSRRAAASAAREDYAAAIADYTRAIALDPGNAQSLYDRGMAHWRNGDEAAARADFSAALKLDPNDAAALMAQGETRLDDKDASGAAADFAAAVRIAPDDLRDVGADYRGAGDYELALAAYDRWIADNPRAQPVAAALDGRCWTRVLWGKELDQALADCDAALRHEPDSPAFLDTCGYVFLRLGQAEKAAADYSAALHLNPKQASSLYGRGVAELRLGHKSQGDADIAAATALSSRIANWAKANGFAP
jgi:tetratricopeptide (TPR) repeat protein